MTVVPFRPRGGEPPPETPPDGVDDLLAGLTLLAGAVTLCWVYTAVPFWSVEQQPAQHQPQQQAGADACPQQQGQRP